MISYLTLRRRPGTRSYPFGDGRVGFKLIGLEAGPLSQWLYSVLAEAGLPVICVETRHMRAMLKAQINKTDRNDARGLAQMMRVGLYRPVHVKTLLTRTCEAVLHAEGYRFISVRCSQLWITTNGAEERHVAQG